MITYGYNECLIITGDFTKISKITNINTDTNTVTVSNYQDLSENNNYLLPIREIPDTTGDRYIGFLSKGAHVEGRNNMAAGDSAHAEGYETQAIGEQSHTEGFSTIAEGIYQHVQGTYNIPDSTSLDIVGNGNIVDGVRSNAYTLDRNGNGWYSGDVYVGSTSGTNKDDGSVKLAKITDIITSYNDLTDKPTIPTKTGDLTNNGDGTTGSKYITNTDLSAGLDSKQDKITGGATTIVSDNLTANKALISNASGKVAVSDTTFAELGYLSGARSNLQGQIDAITTEGGQPNVIEVVQENGTPLEVSNKTVNVIAPTNLVNGIAIGSLRTIGSIKETDTYKLGEHAFAEGYRTTASGNYSHSEGYSTLASAYFSHAEGQNTKALGHQSHAEGFGTMAVGDSAHAEGSGTTAGGNYSHAEGNGTKASSDYSHAEGESTIANGTNQHVQGTYNIADTTSLDIIGNGTSDDNRSNAYTLDKEGNAWYAGNLYVGGTSQTDTNAKKIATEEYVDNKIVTDYDKLTNRPTLNTNITTSQPVSESELITGEMVLHKISKTGSYNDLLNKPTIPTKTSDLTNDSGFVDNSVSNLTNYYNKTETYTQSEVNNLLDNKANKREVMVAEVNRKSWTVSGSWGKVNLLPLQNNNHSGSGKLTYTTNGIKIGSGVTKVLASALFKGIDYSKFLGDVYVNIVRKRGTNELSGAEVYNSHFDTGYFSMGIPPTMLDVAENDLLYLSLGSGAGGTGEILGASLCVEVLE